MLKDKNQCRVFDCGISNTRLNTWRQPPNESPDTTKGQVVWWLFVFIKEKNTNGKF